MKTLSVRQNVGTTAGNLVEPIHIGDLVNKEFNSSYRINEDFYFFF